MENITATKIKSESDEKHSVYALSNGWKATVEYCNAYRIDHVTSFKKDGDFWHCSNSKASLPVFAIPWITKLNQTASIVSPDFLN